MKIMAKTSTEHFEPNGNHSHTFNVDLNNGDSKEFELKIEKIREDFKVELEKLSKEIGELKKAVAVEAKATPKKEKESIKK